MLMKLGGIVLSGLVLICCTSGAAPGVSQDAVLVEVRKNLVTMSGATDSALLADIHAACEDVESMGEEAFYASTYASAASFDEAMDRMVIAAAGEHIC